MAQKRNFNYEKRQKELRKQKKKQEKLEAKRLKREAKNAAMEGGVPDDGIEPGQARDTDGDPGPSAEDQGPTSP